MRQSCPRMPIFFNTLFIFFWAAANLWCVPSTSSSCADQACLDLISQTKDITSPAGAPHQSTTRH